MLSRLRSVAPPSVEPRQIQLAGNAVSFTLKRSRLRRSIGLRIDHQGLTVSVPHRASEKSLQLLLQEKSPWILSKLSQWQAKKSVAPRWEDGEKIAFRGESLTLRILHALKNLPPQLNGDELVLHRVKIADVSGIEKAVLHWYRQQAEQVFQECVAHFAPLMQVNPSELRLTSARTRWGSCTSRGVVRLNWRLVKMPLPLIDYVVVHELAHLRQMNHSAAFWQVVAEVCPDYTERRKALKSHAVT